MALARRNDWSLDGVREVEDNGELDATFRTGTVLARLWAALKIKRKRGEMEGCAAGGSGGEANLMSVS